MGFSKTCGQHGPGVVAFRRRALRSERLQEALIGRTAGTAVGEQVERALLWFDQNQAHPLGYFVAQLRGKQREAERQLFGQAWLLQQLFPAPEEGPRR